MEIIQLHYDIPVAGYGEKWKIMELVARSNKRCGAIYERIQYMLENEEQNRSTSRKVEVK